MADRKGDRHVTPRSHKSGAQKRKDRDEKLKNVEKEVSKIPKIMNFFPRCHGQSTASTSSISIPSSSCEAVDMAAPSPTSTSTLTKTDEPYISIPTPVAIENQPDASSQTEGPKMVVDMDDVNFSADVGLWKAPFQTSVDYWIQKGPHELQHNDEALFLERSAIQSRSDTEGIRRCIGNFFCRVQRNKEIRNREWLCFSPTTGKLYCYICKLMTGPESLTKFSGEGFSNWKRAAEKLAQHETSKNHLDAVIAFSCRSRAVNSVHRELKQQVTFLYIHCLLTWRTRIWAISVA